MVGSAGFSWFHGGFSWFSLNVELGTCLPCLAGCCPARGCSHGCLVWGTKGASRRGGTRWKIHGMLVFLPGSGSTGAGPMVGFRCGEVRECLAVVPSACARVS